jgi:hypothetical protein
MLPMQKRAWFDLGVVVAACAVAAILALLIGLRVSMAAMAVLALVAVKPWLFGSGRKRRSGAGEVLLDERDEFIRRRATTLGFALSYVAFILACLGPWGAYYLFRGEDVVPVDLLVVPVLVGWLVAIVASAVATLIGYSRHRAEPGEDEGGS